MRPCFQSWKWVKSTRLKNDIMFSIKHANWGSPPKKPSLSLFSLFCIWHSSLDEQVLVASQLHVLWQVPIQRLCMDEAGQERWCTAPEWLPPPTGVRARLPQPPWPSVIEMEITYLKFGWYCIVVRLIYLHKSLLSEVLYYLTTVEQHCLLFF